MKIPSFQLCKTELGISLSTIVYLLTLTKYVIFIGCTQNGTHIVCRKLCVWDDISSFSRWITFTWLLFSIEHHLTPNSGIGIALVLSYSWQHLLILIATHIIGFRANIMDGRIVFMLQIPHHPLPSALPAQCESLVLAVRKPGLA